SILASGSTDARAPPLMVIVPPGAETVRPFPSSNKSDTVRVRPELIVNVPTCPVCGALEIATDCTAKSLSIVESTAPGRVTLSSFVGTPAGFQFPATDHRPLTAPVNVRLSGQY